VSNNEWKTQFLRSRDPDQMMRIVGAASGEDARARGYKFQSKDEEIQIEFYASWTDSVPANLLHLLEWEKGLKLLHGDNLFVVKTFVGELQFSKRTSNKDLFEYAERLAKGVADQAPLEHERSSGDGDADLIS
jgi:hypothetical protein